MVVERISTMRIAVYEMDEQRVYVVGAARREYSVGAKDDDVVKAVVIMSVSIML